MPTCVTLSWCFVNQLRKSYYDLRHKKKVYAQSGVEEYWIVDPIESSMEIHQLVDGEFALVSQAEELGEVESAVFPGLTVALAPIFGTEE